MKRLFSLAGHTIAISLLIQCGSSKKDDTVAVGELEGTWSTGCMAEENNTSSKNSALYNGTTSTLSITHYSDAACSDKSLISKTSLSFIIGTAVSAGKKIDSTVISSSLEFSTEAGVASANSQSLYAYTNWKKDLSQDITGKKSQADQDPDVTKGEINYSIFKLEGTKLTFGKQTETEDEKTDAKRATTIDESAVFIKQ